MHCLSLDLIVNAGLAGERSRWEVSIVSLEAQLGALPGDVALASAFMSYAGPFPSQYREDLAKHTWQKQVGTLSFSLRAFKLQCSRTASMVKLCSTSCPVCLIGLVYSLGRPK